MNRQRYQVNADEAYLCHLKAQGSTCWQIFMFLMTRLVILSFFCLFISLQTLSASVTSLRLSENRCNHITTKTAETENIQDKAVVLKTNKGREKKRLRNRELEQIGRCSLTS